MAPNNEQVAAARALLEEVCTVFAEHSDDAVLVGGLVPGLLFPDALPAHVGSIDVDIVLRLQREGYAKLLARLAEKGFYQGRNGYQFFKNMPLANGQTINARLDLLTSQQQHDRYFANLSASEAPEPIRGADVAFADNAKVAMGNNSTLHVAGVVAFLIMKSLAMHARHNEKDAYDIHFCLEAFPGGLEALAELFRPWLGEPLATEALRKMAAKFRSEEDDGPRVVAEMEHLYGESRDIRKLQAASRVQEFIRILGAIQE